MEGLGSEITILRLLQQTLHEESAAQRIRSTQDDTNGPIELDDHFAIHQLKLYTEYCQDQLRKLPESIRKTNLQQLPTRLGTIMAALTLEPNISRGALKMSMRRGGEFPSNLTSKDQDDLIAIAIKLTMAMNCSYSDYRSDRLQAEEGTSERPWDDSVGFGDFVRDSFPVSSTTVLRHPEDPEYAVVRSGLKATNLQRVLGISLRPTNSLREHLQLDREQRVLKIFHHAAFLKHHLRLTRCLPVSASYEESIRLGAIPRPIALEALETLQAVLFPLADKKSAQLLSKLVRNRIFDSEMLKFDYGSIRHPWEENIPFHHFADRLSELSIEMENPRPRGYMEQCLERRSAGRYMLMVTMIGVAFAVLLGIISLGLAGYQTWIAYQAWQHPITQG